MQGMNKKAVPFTEKQIQKIIAKYPTPFHLYDEKGIRETARRIVQPAIVKKIGIFTSWWFLARSSTRHPPINAQNPAKTKQISLIPVLTKALLFRMIMQPCFLLIAKMVPVGSLLSSLATSKHSLRCSLSQKAEQQQ